MGSSNSCKYKSHSVRLTGREGDRIKSNITWQTTGGQPFGSSIPNSFVFSILIEIDPEHGLILIDITPESVATRGRSKEVSFKQEHETVGSHIDSHFIMPEIGISRKIHSVGGWITGLSLDNRGSGRSEGE